MVVMERTPAFEITDAGTLVPTEHFVDAGTRLPTGNKRRAQFHGRSVSVIQVEHANAQLYLIEDPAFLEDIQDTVDGRVPS